MSHDGNLGGIEIRCIGKLGIDIYYIGSCGIMCPCNKHTHFITKNTKTHAYTVSA